MGLFQLTLQEVHRIMAHGAGKGRFYQITLIAGAAGERKDNAMKTTMGLEKFEEEILAFEVSDEALEIAAGASKEKANFTLGACSGLSVCPG
jgi:hypothetical protein